MKQRHPTLAFIALALACLFLFLACRYLLFNVVAPYGPCDLPRKTVTEEDIISEWRAEYKQHGVSDPVAGTVMLISDTVHLVSPDGDLTPLASCSARSPEEAWNRVGCKSDLRGDGYFLNGEEILRFWENGTYQQFFNSETFNYESPINRWELVTSTADSPKLKMFGGRYFSLGTTQAFSENDIVLLPQAMDLRRSREIDPDYETTILYPKSGFTVLYPRACSGDFSLAQMHFTTQDPDNMGVTNPVFKRSDG